MQINFTLKELIQLLTKYWYEKVGLIVVLFIIITIEAGLLVAAKAPPSSYIWILSVTTLLIVIAWFWSRKFPVTGKNKVGFVVSIASSDDDESEKLKEDFILPLRRLIKSGKTGRAFHFMLLPQHLAKDVIDDDDAQALRVSCKAHFILYGQIRLRKIDEKDTYFIELGGVVAHNPIPESVSQKLAQEFGELLPRKVVIQKENDLFSFQFTSEWTSVVAKYIIGIAAALSGDDAYAEKMYREVSKLLEGKNTDFPIYKKLSKRIPMRITELNASRAINAHKLWVDTHDKMLLIKLGGFLGKIDDTQLKRVEVLPIKAIYCFLTLRDTRKAIKYLNQSDHKDVSAWHYSMAFLCGYDGNLKLAIRHYREGLLCPLDVDVLHQIEDFLKWVIEQDKDKYQLYYLLGFFYWKIRDDKNLAVENFGSFLNNENTNEFKKERELALKWNQEIRSKTTE